MISFRRILIMRWHRKHFRQTLSKNLAKFLIQRTINKDGSIHYVPIDDWCSGFFPGNIWYTYELTGDKKWLPLAEKYTEALDSVQYLTWHHDVGFMIGSSYLNGYRFANKEEYKPVIIQTAKSLSTRFRPGCRRLSSLGMPTKAGRPNADGNVRLSLTI